MTALGELGFSSYEEKVYRALLVTGTATAAELSTASDVPKGRIYDVLNGLESRAVIQSQSTEPTKYTAVEPETAVDRLLSERTYELQQELARYRNVAETVRSNLLPTTPADGSVWLGALSSDEMSTALQQHMRTATDSVHAAVGPPYERASWETLQREFEAFFDGAQTDLSVSLVLSDEVLRGLPDTFPELVESKPADVAVRVLPEIPVSFDVIDQAVTTVDIPHPQSPADRLGVVGVKDSTVVAEFERQFQQLWADATPLIE
ncbi:TrmB family transcriptional regulator (plasmid) [Haloferax mediterranei ATCC 33500]|uniref:TrmB family transcriptional regulator n=1 Tax=Haloferax mediterranei (strain ATCC 33500 / DSM 1411 / JCM 8866 / NBRC 14739 / NCIMB 2177 / R-4) TaxID=523841 RepID=I3RBC8_HALMT|nr:helix-turn-helix domain-containing protein [Haloferax mediterranei]AFK21538.1 hypothetical protein HFX_6419 [Haloferax mediterranei ATCC 33500]AHZ24411.1 TrmB family transcriptional regulator [Haloferax mediterranei ATCC 33500]ELZ97152.1 hypothetical protein C439_17558 [Haloferax mediterranei ATCC 33500]MDX5990105.1 helix-turn-helix domain-containing protein [Haloferax mediterranei ATCC 33500]QCQ76810.1 TrmB family transcriptional regulator [Haloferax mediterranei ATCC 33500]